MTKSEVLAQELPKLRRYARALTGNQASGDAYVASALEALAEDAEALERTGSPRIALFKTFSTIWNSIDINRKWDPIETEVGPERHLTRMTPLPRQAFLLLTLEDFSEDAAAEILDVDTPELRRLADEAGREMAAEIATEILIIEDEPMISMELESLVESLGHTVAGVARTHREAVASAKANRPGMILADIRLADDSSGMDAVNELLGLFEVPVIFITAYPEQFLTGSRPEPTFLIPKPFQPATVSAVISQALFFEQRAKAHPHSSAARAGRTLEPPSRRRSKDVISDGDHVRACAGCLRAGGGGKDRRRADNAADRDRFPRIIRLRFGQRRGSVSRLEPALPRPRDRRRASARRRHRKADRGPVEAGGHDEGDPRSRKFLCEQAARLRCQV